MNKISPYTNSLFEQPWWLDAVAPNNWKEIFVTDNKQICARWAFVVDRNKICMPNLTQTLGFWLHPEICENDIYFNKQKDLINQLIDNLPKRDVKLSLDPCNLYFLPFIWRKFGVYPRITYRLENLTNIDALYDGFAKVVKKNIKSAQNKISIREIDDISILYELMEKTFQIQKRKYPLPKELLDRIYEACKQNNACKLLYAVDSENNVYSGALFVYDEHTCYYLISGTDLKYRSSGANSLILWEGIQFASKFSKIFDFEGSMIEGIENFVRQFGAKPVVYYEIRRLNLFQDLLEVLKPRIKRIIGYK